MKPYRAKETDIESEVLVLPIVRHKFYKCQF